MIMLLLHWPAIFSKIIARFKEMNPIYECINPNFNYQCPLFFPALLQPNSDQRKLIILISYTFAQY